MDILCEASLSKFYICAHKIESNRNYPIRKAATSNRSSLSGNVLGRLRFTQASCKGAPTLHICKILSKTILKINHAKFMEIKVFSTGSHTSPAGDRENNRISILTLVRNLVVGRDSSVGIATRYGLDGPGIESRWGRDFLHPSRPALRPTQTPVQ